MGPQLELGGRKLVGPQLFIGLQFDTGCKGPPGPMRPGPHRPGVLEPLEGLNPPWRPELAGPQGTRGGTGGPPPPGEGPGEGPWP